MQPPNEKIPEFVLSKTWELILPKFFKKCVVSSENYGPGINIFKMLVPCINQQKNYSNEITPHKENSSENTNCEYHYVCKDSSVWISVVEKSPKYDEIMRIYDHKIHILVALYIPPESMNSQHGNNQYDFLRFYKNNQANNIGSIKIIQKENKEETLG